MVIGPLYAFLGHRWRVTRSWISAVLITSALCFEPPARRVVGMLTPHPLVWWTEIAIGATTAVAFALMIATARRAQATVAPRPRAA